MCLTSVTQPWVPMGLDDFTSEGRPFVTHSWSCRLVFVLHSCCCCSLSYYGPDISTTLEPYLITGDIFNNGFSVQCQVLAVLHNPFNSTALMLTNSVLYGRLLHTTKFAATLRCSLILSGLHLLWIDPEKYISEYFASMMLVSY